MTTNNQQPTKGNYLVLPCNQKPYSLLILDPVWTSILKNSKSKTKVQKDCTGPEWVCLKIHSQTSVFPLVSLQKHPIKVPSKNHEPILPRKSCLVKANPFEVLVLLPALRPSLLSALGPTSLRPVRALGPRRPAQHVEETLGRGDGPGQEKMECPNYPTEGRPAFCEERWENGIHQPQVSHPIPMRPFRPFWGAQSVGAQHRLISQGTPRFGFGGETGTLAPLTPLSWNDQSDNRKGACPCLTALSKNQPFPSGKKDP